jgi:hypothetical protein
MNQRIRPSINILHHLIKLVGATKLDPLIDDAEYRFGELLTLLNLQQPRMRQWRASRQFQAEEVHAQRHSPNK